MPGSAVILAVTVTESATAAESVTYEIVNDPAVVLSLSAVVAVPFAAVTTNEDVVACEGTELSTPRPKAATATSAMRLKFVFVDMYFLSLVVTRNFLVAASR